jgi:thiamine biosynthesis lipoprotein ApbE
VSPETFRAMGVEVVVGGATAGGLAAVRALFEEWDGVFSRFRVGSELNRVNEGVTPVVAVSPLFARVTRVALNAARATGRLVDPTLSVAMEGHEPHDVRAGRRAARGPHANAALAAARRRGRARPDAAPRRLLLVLARRRLWPATAAIVRGELVLALSLLR